MGIVKYKDHQSFVMADIPGLIEGAHKGKGLGLKFLRHIERTKVLAFLIESVSESIKKDFQTLKNELISYNPQLLNRPAVLVITKNDLLTGNKPLKLRGLKLPVYTISSVTGSGLEELKEQLWQLIKL